jgi:Tol biopolymer transport system component
VILQLPVNLKLHDIARDGRILLSKLDSRTRVFFAGAGGAAPKDLTWFEYATNPGLSADGRTLLMTANDESTGGKALTIVRRTDGSASVRLGEYHGISLSPDGRWVAATAIHQPQPAEITLLPVKAGPPVRLPIGPLQLAGDELAMLPKVGWLPGGSRILFPAKQPGRAPRTFIQDTGGGQPRPLTPEGTWGWLLTPDGRFLLVYDAAANASLFPVEGGGAPQPLPFLKPEFVPLNFTTDGRSLFVCRRGASPAVWRMDLSNGSLDAGRAIPLPDPSPNFFNNQSLRITPDGQSIAYVVNTRLDELYVVHGLR